MLRLLRLLQENHVLVMTPQLLLNMLEAGAAHFHQIALLVRDSCGAHEPAGLHVAEWHASPPSHPKPTTTATTTTLCSA